MTEEELALHERDYYFNPELIAEVRRLQADNALLRGLIKQVNFSSGDYRSDCHWCASSAAGGCHFADCPAFTPDGKVK